MPLDACLLYARPIAAHRPTAPRCSTLCPCRLPWAAQQSCAARLCTPAQADPPEFSQIPPDDIVGVTVILLTCSYREKVAAGIGKVWRECVCACAYSAWSADCMQACDEIATLNRTAGVHPRGLLHGHQTDSQLTADFTQMQEFIRVGYYVNNEYAEEELRDNPPDKPAIDRWVGLRGVNSRAASACGSGLGVRHPKPGL